MTRFRLYRSQVSYPSAKTLADALNGLVIKRRNSKFYPRQRHTVINWGSTDVPYPVDFNQPHAVAMAVNKLSAFRVLSEAGVSVPRFTTDRLEASDWKIVVCRYLLTGHGGSGIEVVDTRVSELPIARLYTEYVPKKDEYRVHVFRGSVFFEQRKARNYSVDEPNWRIRNHANGFVFAHQNLIVPEDVRVQAINAVRALGLDFGAVDVVWNERREKAFVLEVNTAPALQGKTLELYKEQFEFYGY